MSARDDGRIGEQHDAYRKGLVLGLTMAEVGILIIFVLLLLIAFSELQRAGKVIVAKGDLIKLHAASAQLDNIAAGLGIPPETRKEDFARLVKVVRAAAGPGPAKTALEEAREEIKRLADTRVALNEAVEKLGKDPAVSFAEQIERQAEKIGDQEGQLKYFEKKLADAGSGRDERPCWVRPDGTIEYLYDVVLLSTGIQMREYRYPNRESQRARLPMPVISEEAIWSPGEFLRLTRPLYDSSLAENCRFFVVVYDGTAADEKALYKSLLHTVEAHFYKRNANVPPPF